MARYELTEEQRATVAAAAERARERLASSDRADAAVQTLLVKRPTFDERMDGEQPVIITVIATRSHPMTVSMGFDEPTRSTVDAHLLFENVVADFLSDEPGVIQRINDALTEEARP